MFPVAITCLFAPQMTVGQCREARISSVNGGVLSRTNSDDSIDRILPDTLPSFAAGGKLQWDSAETLATDAGVAATVVFLDCPVIIQIGENSRVRLLEPARDYALHLQVTEGVVTVSAPPNDPVWHLVAIRDEAFTLFRGALIQFGPQNDIRIGRGEAVQYKGTVPQRPLLVGGKPDKPDEVLTPQPEVGTRQQNSLRTANWYTALSAGDGWIRHAQENDLIPSRGAGQSSLTVSISEFGERQNFDKPRTGSFVVALASAPRESVVATTRPSVVEELFDAGDPGNVAVAVRLQRTRIIGTESARVSSGGVLLQANELFRKLQLNTGS